MSTNPTISLVTSLSRESAFIPQTIESVLAQDYSNVEHIVVDGMMTAATARLQSQYSHLKIIRAPSPGLAQAINAGFHAASGEIFGLLHADHTLEPGALRAIADARADGRHVVGPLPLVGADGGYFGVECPSALEALVVYSRSGRADGLRSVPCSGDDRHGDLRTAVEAPASMLDYDLFCRFSRQYPFHRLDQVVASSRFLAQSPVISDEGRLEEAIAVSRRYWGRPFGIQYWQLLASYAAFRANRRSRAAGLMRSGRQLVRGREHGAGLGKILIGGALAPEVGLDVAAPVVKRAAARLRIQLNRQPRRRQPATEQWFSHTSLHQDGWAGPTLEQEVTVEAQHTTLALSGTVSVGHLRRPLELEAFLDGRPLGRSRVGQAGPFAVTWNLNGVHPGPHQLRIRANTFAGAPRIQREPGLPSAFVSRRPTRAGTQGTAALMTRSIVDLLDEIARLPSNWHEAGTVEMSVLHAIARHAEALGSIEHSVETGSGKTTLLFSHLSKHHVVFAVDAGRSISQVRESALFNAATTVFVEGPTQRTLARHEFHHTRSCSSMARNAPFPDLEYFYLYQLAPGGCP
jgi:hypothetical protein